MSVRLEGDQIIFTKTIESNIPMSPAMREFIFSTAERSGRIPAIKFVRAEYSLDLRQAKDIVDYLLERRPVDLGQLLRDKLDRS